VGFKNFFLLEIRKGWRKGTSIYLSALFLKARNLKKSKKKEENRAGSEYLRLCQQQIVL
jgi:hypothetical protein